MPVDLAAYLMNIRVDTIYRWIHTGKIKAYGFKGCYRVSSADLLPEVQPKPYPKHTKKRNRTPTNANGATTPPAESARPL
jgi:excisionase family DNA binding protein